MNGMCIIIYGVYEMVVCMELEGVGAQASCYL